MFLRVILLLTLSLTSLPADIVLPARFLLVAAEGLYIIEKDARCSWKYQVPPIPGEMRPASFDDVIYDGCALPDGHFLYAAHRYAREIDAAGCTVWEYRVKPMNEVKTVIPLPENRVAVLDADAQAILELERGSGRELRRIPVPAKGTYHTRYNLLRRTPEGHYLVTLRAENRFIEVDAAGAVLRSFPSPGLPVVASRLADGSTLGGHRGGLTRYDEKGAAMWSLTQVDFNERFQPLLIGGSDALPDGSLLVVNSDWHAKTTDPDRIHLFTLSKKHEVTGILTTSALSGWKRGQLEPLTGITEHRCMAVQVLPEK